MNTKKFQIIAIDAKRHRKSAPQKQVRIDHNTTILSLREKNNKELDIEIRYTVSYGLLGIVQLDCGITYFNKSEKNITETAEKWEKEHKLPDSIAEIVHNQVLARGSFEVLNIAKKLNLPPPFKIEIPQIKIGKNEYNASKQNRGPEIA